MIFLTDDLIEKLREVEGSAYKEITWSGNDIYGIGGLNRYYVNVEIDGELRFETFEPNEILFSAFHSRSRDIQKAEEVGFRIFD
jgi:hypothetical protein